MACSLLPLEELSQLFSQADATCVNLECVLSQQGTPMHGKRYHLRAQAASICSLVDQRIDVVNVANNHLLDLGPEAARDSIDTLSAHGIKHCGLQCRENDRRQVATVVNVNGSKVALLSYVDSNLLDPSPEPFLSHLPRPYWLDGEAIVRDLHHNKRRADLQVVQLHWGTEWSHVVRADQRTLARSLIDHGAAAVIGHHPHVIQDYEEYKGGLICYSLGNLFFNLPGIQATRARFGFLVNLNIDCQSIMEYRMIPTEIKGGRATFAGAVTFDGWESGITSTADTTGQRRWRLSNHIDKYQIFCEGDGGYTTFGQSRAACLHRIPLPEAHVDESAQIVAKSREFYGNDLRQGVLCYFAGKGVIRIMGQFPQSGVLRGYLGVPNCFVENWPSAETQFRVTLGSNSVIAEVVTKEPKVIGPIVVDSAVPMSIEIQNPLHQEVAFGFDIVDS